jgi:hypothetical protein
MQTELVKVSSLRSHPKNYRHHPADQIAHIAQSIREHGVYRPVVIARDGTILAGHGVVEALKSMGTDDVPVFRLDVSPDDSRALKLLAGDNEISHLGEIDDRALSDLLMSLKGMGDLLGTGYDDMMLANLVFVTRPEKEVKDFNEAAAWVGLPEFESVLAPVKIVVSFHNPEDRDTFAKQLSLIIMVKNQNTWSAWWPAPPEGSETLASKEKS